MRSKWLDWTPQDQILEKRAAANPTKPTEVVFDGFVGDLPGLSPNIGAPEPVEAPESHIFPHCPRCASYALYRRNNEGDYECETCGLEGIAEAVARRTQ